MLVFKSLDLVLSGWILTSPTIFTIQGGFPVTKFMEYGNTTNAKTYTKWNHTTDRYYYS